MRFMCVHIQVNIRLGNINSETCVFAAHESQAIVATIDFDEGVVRYLLVKGLVFKYHHPILQACCWCWWAETGAWHSCCVSYLRVSTHLGPAGRHLRNHC